jgi:glycosyltransferase involved in cell wall biosynthesis
MTVGFHSPLPPARTGVAEYAAALGAALGRLCDVRVGAERADVHLYQLGNNALHAELYRQALARPGVVVLHDAVLQHLLLGMYGRAEYVDEFVYNYGEWMRDTAVHLWEQRARSGVAPEYFRYAMLRRVGERSRAVIAHNPAAARIVREHAPAAQVYEIPHLYEDTGSVPREEVEGVRSRWGVPPGGVVFGVFGHLRETKRIASVLRAFDVVRRRYGNARLVVAGECVSPQYERTLEPAMSAPGVIREGGMSVSELRRSLSSVDVCVNLRYPGAGETSGIAIRTMGMGGCVVLGDAEENSRYPKAAVVRVDGGTAERPMLEAMMMWLAGDRMAAREIGARAAVHIRTEHEAGRVARLYSHVLAQSLE